MQFANSNGTRVGYRMEGQGAAVVLVHGTGGDGATNWAGVTEQLQGDFTVIRPDYAGSGQTEAPSGPLTVADLAAQVLAAVDHAGIVRFALVGFSLGAAVAAQIAADHPNRVNSLVLIGGFMRPDARLRMQFELWQKLIAADRATMARLVLLTGFAPDVVSDWGEAGLEDAVRDMVATQNWPGMAQQTAVDLSLDVSAAAARIAAPTLVLGSAQDHMVPTAHARALADTIAHSTYQQLPGGHLAPMEQPDLIAAYIRAHVQERAGAAAGSGAVRLPKTAIDTGANLG